MLETISINLEYFVSNIASFVSVLIEVFGVIIIIVAIAKHLYRCIAVHKLNASEIQKDKNFNAALSVALEILLGAEILKTLTVSGNFNDLIEVVLLIIVRILMAVVLHFENKADNKTI